MQKIEWDVVMGNVFSLTILSAWLGFVFAFVTGWIMNIVKIVGLFGTPTGDIALEISLRITGIFFAPIGAILGWF